MKRILVRDDRTLYDAEVSILMKHEAKNESDIVRMETY